MMNPNRDANEPNQPTTDVTRLVTEVAGGNSSAANELLPLVYDQLRAVAQQRMGSERPGHTLQATALVHEAFLRLVGPRELPWHSQAHFYAAAAEAMRRILVDHAHQKGIIHRDIKPSNVLVTIADDQPVVKVIDFGIAKATNCELTEKTLFTEFRQLIGTPQYMSPEQAERSGVDIDTRTDVYSLGVLLYEMLSGRTPLDPKKLNSAAWGELQRMIVEEEPTKPSVMVSSSLGEITEVAKRRATEPARLGTLLRGDLDWIVLKAIEKDRSRRYSTASHFAADIDRFLNNEAVEASPPSKIYQLRKFARRNRALLTTAAVVFLVLVAGLITTSTAATWAIREQRATEKARSVAEKEARSMRRAATLAGASMILPESDARRLAQDWKDEIAEMQSSTGKNDADTVMLESQYTTWFANWLLNHRRADEAAGLIDVCYDRAREVIGVDNPTFLALCNVRIVVNEVTAADRQQNARTFADLIQSLEAIQGEDEAAELSPQYAAALVDADRSREAAEAVQRYLAYRSRQSTPPSANENARLDKSIDQMMNSRRASPELIRQLTSVRETGATTAAVPSVANDKELAQDLETFQGRWEHKRWAQGKIVEHMMVQFDGQSSTTQWVEDGKPGRGRRGRFELSRSGGAKVMTTFLGAGNTGLTFIYHLEKDTFSNVSGMLTNHDSLPNVEFRQWHRISNEEQQPENDGAAVADGSRGSR